MIRKVSIFVALVFLFAYMQLGVFAGIQAGSSQDPQTPKTPPSSQTPSGKSSTPGQTAPRDHPTKSEGKLHASDHKFVTEAAEASLAEVELGRVAVDRASNADVKKFAQQMVDDHSKANDELKGLAAQKGVTLPSGPNGKDRALKDRLSKLSGAEFDRQYMQEMVKDHKKAVTLFQHEANQGHDPDLKSWASKTLPALQEHLKMANDTASKVGVNVTSQYRPPKK